MSDRLTLIYFTDFHGTRKLYDDTLKSAVERGVKLLATSGDLLPHRSGEPFITGWFGEWLERCKKKDVTVLGMLGNDDGAYLQKYIDEYETQGLFRRIDGRFVDYQGWTFWGYNFVPELPFGLKDWVKLDYEGAPRPPQLSGPVLSSENGLRSIMNIESFFKARGTIENDLSKVGLPHPERTIVITHSPPRGYGLDVTANLHQVGSLSVLKFILEQQPLLSLHGHIHESPRSSGVWKTQIGKTTSCQPGQFPVSIRLRSNSIDIEYVWEQRR